MNRAVIAAIAATALVAGGAGFALGGGLGRSADPAPAAVDSPSPASSPAPAPASPTSDPPEPSPEPEPAPTADADTFDVELFITENKCFDSAGSSIEFEPELIPNEEIGDSLVGTLAYRLHAGSEELGLHSVELIEGQRYEYDLGRASPDACYDDNEITAEVVRIRTRN